MVSTEWKSCSLLDIQETRLPQMYVLYRLAIVCTQVRARENLQRKGLSLTRRQFYNMSSITPSEHWLCAYVVLCYCSFHIIFLLSAQAERQPDSLIRSLAWWSCGCVPCQASCRCRWCPGARKHLHVYTSHGGPAHALPAPL